MNVDRQLDVFWERRQVGRYCRLADGSECFAYDSDYLERNDAMPISHSLPLRSEPYGKVLS